ncbi:glycosyltransferase family A protein [Synoicihabitans lomoniglobus]|uniref:Glycosyltransferase family A protein n=1 Tax=Synoicihabitans lomoniglobus TaxID=2909285 RepID=A0AAE9ZVH6_9BACT|nr:glycosyltransferase family 2 protein [Opitutaceae bacterium LMO-M01]WED64136.1 glycosyltransferase family A protein [Opitutaceae bacterium LMO-M01]
MITLITPTTGHPRLREAVRSVQRQTQPDIRHLVVIDGEARRAAAEAILAEVNFTGQIMVVPEITGGEGFNGHLIYLTVPFLVKTEFVALLDEDNTFEPDHFSRLLSLCDEHRLDWAYSLRQVFADSGERLRDDCQSLGFWPAYAGAYHHIDTSCYFVRREVWKRGIAVWDRPFKPEVRSPDQAFCGWLMHHYPRGYTSGHYTMNYWLGSNGSGGAEAEERRLDYFRVGNAVQAEVYRHFPWRYGVPGTDVPYGNMSVSCRDSQLARKFQSLVQDLRRPGETSAVEKVVPPR